MICILNPEVRTEFVQGKTNDKEGKDFISFCDKLISFGPVEEDYKIIVEISNFD